MNIDHWISLILCLLCGVGFAIKESKEYKKNRFGIIYSVSIFERKLNAGMGFITGFCFTPIIVLGILFCILIAILSIPFRLFIK